MDFKIKSVSPTTGIDWAEKVPYGLLRSESGFLVSAKCKQDKREILVFIPRDEITDIEKVKMRLLRQYNEDVEKEMKEEAEKALGNTLVGKTIDP